MSLMLKLFSNKDITVGQNIKKSSSQKINVGPRNTKEANHEQVNHKGEEKNKLQTKLKPKTMAKNILFVKFTIKSGNIPNHLQQVVWGSAAPGSTSPRGCVRQKNDNSNTLDIISTENEKKSLLRTCVVAWQASRCSLRHQQTLLSTFVSSELTDCETFLSELQLTVNRAAPLYSCTPSPLLLLSTLLIHMNRWEINRRSGQMDRSDHTWTIMQTCCKIKFLYWERKERKTLSLYLVSSSLLSPKHSVPLFPLKNTNQAKE